MTPFLDMYRLRNKEFSDYCEYATAFELTERGWKVFQPMIDRYIDLVAIKEINGKLLFRTIQVKSSRVETKPGEDPESYGFTHKPKDLLHDPSHFFVWVLVDRNNKFHYFILTVKDFIDLRTVLLPHSTRRKHPSLLMRDEWRWGTDRIHPKHWINHQNEAYKKLLPKLIKPPNIDEPSWTIENAVFDQFYGAWDKLEQIDTESNAPKVIAAQEIKEEWKSMDANIIKKWKLQNDEALKKLKKYPEIYESATKLRELEPEEE